MTSYWLSRDVAVLRARHKGAITEGTKVASMKAIIVLAMGALLGTVAACRNELSEDRPEVPAFIMQQCSPVDPQCQLAEPPRLDERPGPGTQ